MSLIPPWLPDWRNSDAYTIPLDSEETNAFALHIIAFDYLRRNPKYLRDYDIFNELSPERKSEETRNICGKYGLSAPWVPDPAIDPRSNSQPTPTYRETVYPHMTIGNFALPEVPSIPVLPGTTLIAFSDDLPIAIQLESAASQLRQARNIQRGSPQRLNRQMDKLLVGLRLLDARQRDAKWEEIRNVLFPDSYELSTVRKAYEHAIELRDGLYQFIPITKGSWGI